MTDPQPASTAFARLRRAVESTDPEVESFVERFGLAYMATLTPGEALRWERMITQLAQAAEELGYDATAEEIDRRAQELEKRPT
ncbi:hypothetical protein [Phenylobacterium sp.]|uniref:hypothetical protein n=1 Tax=Phenylobacterium sp. TaxID=1871053 RepID=UPI00121BBF5A|nr:hypothetical protein [Phenylobacterium sp.]THD64168.1 MAG: hypothetical protein E8A12_08280 [Phenylobacterium sp.]